VKLLNPNEREDSLEAPTKFDGTVPINLHESQLNEFKLVNWKRTAGIYPMKELYERVSDLNFVNNASSAGIGRTRLFWNR
jgi:hypothetical protein